MEADFEGLDEALVIYRSDELGEEAALAELLRDAHRRGLDVARLAAEVERQEASVVELRR